MPSDDDRPSFSDETGDAPLSSSRAADAIKEIFADACDQPLGERDALLRLRCGDDAELRRAVDTLLRAHDEAGNFFAGPTGAPQPDRETISAVGQRIGRYKLLQLIGEGGFGTVYMAEQEQPVRRRVALKIIKLGMDTRSVIARFEAERQALAMMDHPSVAKVLDGGATDAGRPYFVMELVKGLPITEYCDKNNLTIRSRLELFTQVCQAVQHAHQKGLIHRDIKPSNVLVSTQDDHPVAKVIDFGIAKAMQARLTEKTLFTEFRQLVGTPEYMSPEQAQGDLDVDTRSDLYSLGVLLYEMLAGSPPFDPRELRSHAFADMQRIICEVEPPTPSMRLHTGRETLPSVAANRAIEPRKLEVLVRGELDWIVMHCLEKDRKRRYQTASALAEDIHRYLSDQPVLVCPPSHVYRFRKFARRNRTALLAMCAVLATLVLLVIGLATSNRLIGAERDQKAAALKEKEQALATAKASEEAAHVNAQRAEAESKRAEESFLRASIAIREILTKAAMGTGEWSRLPPPLRQRFSAEAVKFYESYVQENSPDPKLQYEAGVGYRAIGTLHTTAGELPEAEKSFRLSIAILERLATQYPAIQEYRQQWAWSLVNLGRSLHRPQQLEEGRNVLQKAAELYETLVSEKPGDVNYRVELTTCYIELAGRLTDVGAQKQAESVLKRGITLYEDPSVKQSDPAECNQRLAAMHLSLGRVLMADHRGPEPKAALLTAAQHYKDACALTPTAPCLYGWGECYLRQFDLSVEVFPLPEREQAYLNYLKIKSSIPNNLLAQRDLREQSGHMYRTWGFTLSSTDRRNETEAAYLEAAKVFDKLTVDEPGFEKYWKFAADTHFQIGNLMMQSGRKDAAERELNRAIGLYDQLTANFPTLGTTEREAAWRAQAQMYFQMDQPEKAVAEVTKAVELDPKDDSALAIRGDIYRKIGQLAKTVEDYSEAIKLKPDRQWYWHERADAYRLLGEHKEAIADDTKAIELGDSDSGERLRRGDSYEALGDRAKAKADYSRAIELNPGNGEAWLRRSLLNVWQGRPDEAKADLSNAIAHCSNDPNVQNGLAWELATNADPSLRDPKAAVELAGKAVALKPTDGNIWNTLGVAQYRAGDWKAAVAALNKSVELRHGGDASDWYFLAMASQQLGQPDAARKWYDQSVRWEEQNSASLKTNVGRSNELRRFREEAQSLIHPTTQAGSTDHSPATAPSFKSVEPVAK